MRTYYNEGEIYREKAERLDQEASELKNQVEKLTLQLETNEKNLEKATQHSHLYYQEISKAERALEL